MSVKFRSRIKWQRPTSLTVETYVVIDDDVSMKLYGETHRVKT